ncbi:hypothetical protein HD806DRAFT_505310 [Xylariaceae sp. AK1471]|nr:hypothetical protein HD806DRAFT_505310 [Xylariaceae sp. AK1471]
MGPTSTPKGLSLDTAAWYEAIRLAHYRRIQFSDRSQLAQYLNSSSHSIQPSRNNTSASLIEEKSKQDFEYICIFGEHIVRTWPLQMKLCYHEDSYISVETASRLSLDTTVGSKHDLFWYKQNTAASSLIIQRSTFRVANIDHQVVLGKKWYPIFKDQYPVSSTGISTEDFAPGSSLLNNNLTSPVVRPNSNPDLRNWHLSLEEVANGVNPCVSCGCPTEKSERPKSATIIPPQRVNYTASREWLSDTIPVTTSSESLSAAQSNELIIPTGNKSRRWNDHVRPYSNPPMRLGCHPGELIPAPPRTYTRNDPRAERTPSNRRTYPSEEGTDYTSDNGSHNNRMLYQQSYRHDREDERSNHDWPENREVRHNTCRPRERRNHEEWEERDDHEEWEERDDHDRRRDDIFHALIAGLFFLKCLQ